MIMNWIILGMCFILIQQQQQTSIKNYIALATPLIPEPQVETINPFIRHWEPAKFDRTAFENAHQKHQATRRRKREVNYNYGSVNSINFNFAAHNREFHVELIENPSSVFSTDVVIENTDGPVDYDISRVYVGKLKDDENSHVHGVLTKDNLFDGTIITNTEQYYIEPSNKYSNQLHKNGVHTIIYKLSDVRMHNENNNNEHCASEKLHKKIKSENNGKSSYFKHNLNEKSDNYRINSNTLNKKDQFKNLINQPKRKKRWLPDELSESPIDPPPLDFEIRYSDENTKNSNDDQFQSDQPVHIPNLNINNNKNKNFIVNNYNPPNGDIFFRNIMTKNSNRNILLNVYDNNNHNTNRVNNNFSVTQSSSNLNSKPNHKTHVEIITKHGPTKKPNIIVNNYNPDQIFANNNNNNNNNNNHNHNQHPHLLHPYNFNLNVRNDLSESYSLRPASHISERKMTCMLYLQADHTFTQRMGSDEASIESITRHVQRANVIYKNTDFNGDGKPDNITFMIKRIKVHNANALKDPTYRFSGNYGVEKFLELFSEEDYDAFCLAYMFTYRDFEMGTLGLAWTGDLKNAGGVCEKNGHYRGSLKSLNTGIVTLLNYGKHVPPAVSHVTLAHEIGHNFGSPHDPEQCTPGGEDGNFIMFARATSGDKRNNNKFSPCSLKSIEPVLNAKARSMKGCFTEPQQSICGNGVVEAGEQCDCGWEEDCKDACCFPMSRHPKYNEKPCTLTPRAKCSPSQGPCCTTECTLKFGDKCRDDNGCRDPSFCNGGSPDCPPSINKANKTICNKEFVCYMGECTGSICLAYGLESCQCIPGPNDPKTKACELCCKEPGEESPCISSFQWNKVPYDVPDMYAKPGTPCNDYNGYCDVFQKCREVDPSGPLATLRKLLLSEESIASFKKWVQGNWYAVVAIIISILALMVLSAKLLGKRTNSKLKTVTIIHSATTETVRLPDDNNGVIVHTAVRSKVPLKKKVRGERSKSKHHPPQKPSVAPAAATTKDALQNLSTNAVATPTKNASKLKKRSSKAAESPRKILKRKKKRSISTEDVQLQNKEKDNSLSKPLKKLKKKSNHKEIIDYSNSEQTNHTNTFGKVQKWLLESPIVSTPPSQIQHSSKTKQIMSKSQSTPEQLAPNQRSPTNTKTKAKTNSVSNLNEKVRLQVVYKPPFKFSLKLSKNDSSVKTQLVKGSINKSKRKFRVDRKRVMMTDNNADDIQKNRRTALLIRSATDETANQLSTQIINEPNYETINTKLPKHRRQQSLQENPTYENLNYPSTSNLMEAAAATNQMTTPIINTATFKINKSASGGNINKRNLPVIGTPTMDSNRKSTSHKGSNQNLNLFGTNGSGNSGTNSHERRSSLSRSTQNLMRSSTTNLAHAGENREIKRRGSAAPHDMNRSSTTNLNKYNRQHSGSNLNLRRGNSNIDLIMVDESCNSNPNGSSGDRERKSNSRKNSVNSKSNLPSAFNTSNVENIPTAVVESKNLSSRRDSFNNNIPRASLNSNNFQRQTSLNIKPLPSTSSNRVSVDEINSKRPQTSSCDNSKKKFEWPKILSTDSENILPSDLEVMVSDVENLVSDR